MSNGNKEYTLKHPSVSSVRSFTKTNVLLSIQLAPIALELLWDLSDTPDEISNAVTV